MILIAVCVKETLVIRDTETTKRLNFGCGEDIKEGWDNLDYKDFDFVS